ncbi:Uncharacterised protein [Vibrio cholerae]|nr:Uncharacterised protein [Vibrio cholerae]
MRPRTQRSFSVRYLSTTYSFLCIERFSSLNHHFHYLGGELTFRQLMCRDG